MSKEIILKRPILTEKALIQQEEDNKFAFVVDPNANKIEIRNAVENNFKSLSWCCGFTFFCSHNLYRCFSSIEIYIFSFNQGNDRFFPI